MDSYLFNDAILWHAAEPIRPHDPAHGAVRSILTFDFHHKVRATARATTERRKKKSPALADFSG